MSIEEESAALKYIRQVFNTLYVTQDDLRSFNVNQQDKKNATDAAVTGENSKNVADFVNMFSGNKHRWLAPTLNGIDVPTTVAYCLLFLSCNTISGFTGMS